MIIIGTSGGARDAMAAMAEDGRLVGACPQERVTRVRGAGLNASGVPDEAIDLLLRRRGRTRADIGQYISVEGGEQAGASPGRLDRLRAHACTAFLTSPFSSSAIVVCDHVWPGMSVWSGNGATLKHEWTWPGARLTHPLLVAASALGLQGLGGVRRAEALARLRPASRDTSIDSMLALHDGDLVVDSRFEPYLAERAGHNPDAGTPSRIQLASAVQGRVGEILLELLREVRQRLGLAHLCLGGSLFHLSGLNSIVKEAGLFDDVFVPVEPGESGLAVGAVLDALGAGPTPTSPFLGPSYSFEEVKEVLDNCKLHYSWESEEGAVQVVVKSLREGRLVGWFDGPMEWGPRALGARSILASPTAPYVLENLNRFLKRREPWRGYALSGLQEAVDVHFDGPASAPFMECDYRPKDATTFQHVLPSPEAAIRVQTVAADGSLPRFRRVLEAVGETTGLPFVVNTSFNGFHEPIVCSPRDAVRVFYGTGLDVLVINQFVVRK
ncbi:MAG: hypothetical protein IT177_24355 [Acidobacteria bacterium]|nr:hypothetical protein [Acidobacteriota bacterium]